MISTHCARRRPPRTVRGRACACVNHRIPPSGTRKKKNSAEHVRSSPLNNDVTPYSAGVRRRRRRTRVWQWKCYTHMNPDGVTGSRHNRGANATRRAHVRLVHSSCAPTTEFFRTSVQFLLVGTTRLPENGRTNSRYSPSVTSGRFHRIKNAHGSWRRDRSPYARAANAMPFAVRDSVAGGGVVVAKRQRRGRLAKRGGGGDSEPDRRHGGTQVLSARRDRIRQIQPREKTLLARQRHRQRVRAVDAGVQRQPRDRRRRRTEDTAGLDCTVQVSRLQMSKCSATVEQFKKGKKYL